MPDGRSDLVNIQETLRRFGTAPDVLAQERRSLPATPRTRLDVLLREIDETVLARNIKLYAHDRHLASLTVSNRRLLRFQGVASEDTQPRSEKPTAREFAECLLDIAKTTTRFSTENVAKQDKGAGPETGCSIAALRSELGLNGGQNTIARLAQLLEKTAAAQLTWTADVESAEYAGDDNLRDFLMNFARAAVENMSGPHGALPHAVEPAGLALPVSVKSALVFACDARSGVAAITPLDQGLKTLGDWQLTTSAT
jgi:hypothetical protein